MLVDVEFSTLADCEEFVKITSQIHGRIELYSRSDRGTVFSGKSLMGVLAAAEKENLCCVADEDIRDKISKFITISKF